MNNEPYQYYFDVLPIHPLPQPLQTQSDYLSGLLTLNGITSKFGLRTFFGASIRGCLVDIPPSPTVLETFSQVTSHSVTVLLETTFYHVCHKFRQVAYGKNCANFLQASVSFNLRYCPLCIAENPYYRLPWRFLVLKGCPIHRCCLLDKCGHCHREISLTSTLLMTGVCPFCRGDLRLCPSQKLDDSQQQIAFDTFLDLVYLLTHQDWENENHSILEYLGQQLERRRLEIGQGMLKDTAASMGMNSSHLSLFEHGSAGSLLPYLEYSHYLRYPLRDLFADALTNKPTFERVVVAITPQDIIATWHQLTKANTSGKRITQRKIADALGIHLSSLWNHPELRDVLSSIAAQPIRDEDDLLAKAQQAYTNLSHEHNYVTQDKIAVEIGLSSATLVKYPKVRAFLRQVSPVARFRELRDSARPDAE